MRVLFLGGKPKNIPRKRLKKDVMVVHYGEKDKELVRGEFSGGIPDIIFCFLDYIGHTESKSFRAAAQKHDIPFIAAKGGFSHMISQAEEQGLDIGDILVNGTIPKSPPAPPQTKPEPSKDYENGDYDKKFLLPRVAREAYVNNGLKVYTMIARNNTLALLIKREVMEDVCRLARDLGYKEWLPLPAAELIVEELEKMYGLEQRGITVTAMNVQKNVNNYRGAKASGKQKRGRPKGVVETKPRTPKGTKPSKPIPSPVQSREMDQEQVQKEINKIMDQMRGKVKQSRAIAGNNAYEIFLTEMALHYREVDEARKETVALLREIIALKSDNAAFLEQAVGAETELRTKQDRIEQLERDVDKWKTMATN